MNIVRVYRDERWLDANIPILETFWKEVEYYRKNDITKHPKFPKTKTVLDLTSKNGNENENENENGNGNENGNENENEAPFLSDYAFRD